MYATLHMSEICIRTLLLFNFFQCFTFLDPLPVENLFISLAANIVNITWSPSSIFNGLIIVVQYIVQRIDSGGKSYYSVSGDQHYMELPYFNDALVSVAAVNQYGQSSFELAKSSGKKDLNITFIYACVYIRM